MADFSIDIKGLKEADNMLVRMGTFLKKPARALKEIGINMLKSVDRNFAEQGRPERWTPLAPSTLQRRRNKNKSSAMILQDTGRLRQSISYQLLPEDEGVAIGTNVKYGKAHQYGTIIPIYQHTRIATIFRHKGKRKYRKYTPLKKPFTVKAHSVKIPKRKFLLFQDEDIPMIQSVLISGLAREIKKGDLGTSS